MRFRDRHRLARHREFLDAARTIMASEGRAGLTMQRVTHAVGSSTGGIYVYFRSKEALIAALQRDAIEALTESYEAGQELLDVHLAEASADPVRAALARLVATGQFWSAADQALPHEVGLARGFLTPGGASETSGDEATEEVLPAVLSLFDHVGRRISGAASVGAIEAGSATERALVLVSTVTVILYTSTLSRWDQELFDGNRLAHRLVHDLLIGWGAHPPDLDAAEALLTPFTQRARLAPPRPT